MSNFDFRPADEAVINIGKSDLVINIEKSDLVINIEKSDLVINIENSDLVINIENSDLVINIENIPNTMELNKFYEIVTPTEITNTFEESIIKTQDNCTLPSPPY